MDDVNFGEPLWTMPLGKNCVSDCRSWPAADVAVKHACALAKVTDDPRWKVDLRCQEMPELLDQLVRVLSVWSEGKLMVQLVHLWADLTAGRVLDNNSLTISRFEKAGEDIAWRWREVQRLSRGGSWVAAGSDAGVLRFHAQRPGVNEPRQGIVEHFGEKFEVALGGQANEARVDGTYVCDAYPCFNTSIEDGARQLTNWCLRSPKWDIGRNGESTWKQAALGVIRLYVLDRAGRGGAASVDIAPETHSEVQHN